MRAKWKAVVAKLSPGLRKILGNVGWLFAERLLTMIVAFGVGVYVIRYLGVLLLFLGLFIKDLRI